MSQTFEITAPDGTKYRVTGPDGATEQDALAQVQAQHQAVPPAQEPKQPSLAMAPVGGAEMLLKLGTGALASIPAGVAYGGAAIGKAFGANVDPAAVQRQVQQSLTYQPLSDSAKAGEQALGNIGRAIGNNFGVPQNIQAARELVQKVDQRSPFIGSLIRATPGAFQAAASVVPAVASARSAIETVRAPFTPPPILSTADAMRSAPTAESIVTRQAAASEQNMGAASAAPSLTNVSPELRQSIVATAQKTGGAINPEVLSRHMEADTLPVRMRLTEGQATQNPRLISQEMNARGNTGMVEHLNLQNRQLAENVRAIRDEIGPEVFSTNPAEHGDTLIAAYRASNDAAQAQISALYDQLRNAAGGSFPVDGQALLRDASTRLHRELLFEHAPKAIMGQLRRLANGGMTFEQFEAMRTNLATIQRSQSASGLERRAAGIIREAMEELPLGPAAAQLKPYADAARQAARAQFQAIAADPAYEAAISGTVPPDRFVNRFILSAPRDQVALMRANLAGNDAALQTMGVSLLDHLRDQARLNPNYQGNFAAASFNRALTQLEPKLRSLVDTGTAEQLEKLGNVARYVTSQPRGSYVNNSNTFVAGAASQAANVAEKVTNKLAFGLPVGTVTRNALAASRQRNAFQRSIAPGAGLGNLEEPH